MRTLLLRSNIFKVSRTVQARQFSSFPQQRFVFDPIEITALLFRSFHDVSGLTYGIAIPLTTVALRTIVTLPLSIYSQKKLQRRLELRPLFTKWGEVKGMQVVAEQKARNLDLKGNKKAMSEAMSLVRKMTSDEMKKIYKRHGSSNLRIFLPTIVQIPLFIMVSLALRSMTGWPGWFDIGMGAPIEPLLHTEGFGPIKDLTQPDGTFVLPVLVGLLNVVNVQVTDAKRSITFTNPIATRIRNITKFSLITLSALMIPVAMQAPAAISLYWVSSVAFSLVQNILIRKFVPLPPPFVALSALGGPKETGKNGTT